MDIFVNYAGLLIILVCSLIYTFFGYRFFKALLSFAGALIFSSVAWNISSEYFHDNKLIAFAITLLAGLFGAWLFHKVFKVAAFLYGAAAGLSLSPIVLTFIENPPDWCKWGLPIVCALMGGILLLISHRFILITMTAASGALYFSMSLTLLLVQWEIIQKDILDKPDKLQTALWLLCFATCFVSGWVYQLKDKETKEDT
ncbi:MAG: TMEM198/TM7SF3 family protein [Lentisphaeraceae bacterium]|nr:TMEM198/TM7SF3 family protein [Lentisphaeraceae bacterium]